MAGFDQVVQNIVSNIFGDEDKPVTRPKERPTGLGSRVDTGGAVDVSLRPRARPNNESSAPSISLRPRARDDDDDDDKPNPQGAVNNFVSKMSNFIDDDDDDTVEVPLSSFKTNADDLYNKHETSAAELERLNQGNTTDKVKVKNIKEDTYLDRLFRSLRPSRREIDITARERALPDLDTRAIQQNLKITHGYDIDVDGIMGPQTRKAIKDFQKEKGLKVDGIVGPATTRELVQMRDLPIDREPALPGTGIFISEMPEPKPTRAIGSVGFADPRVVDPTTNKPYTSAGLGRRQQYVDLYEQYEKDSSEAKEIVLRPRVRPDDVEPVPTGIMVRPRVRPDDVEPITVTPEAIDLLKNITNPVDAVIALGYIKEKGGRVKKTTSYESLLNEEDNADTIADMFNDAVGELSDPKKTAWCATFVDHILNELGVKRIETDDKYDRLRAKAYENYGNAVENLNSAKRGDLAVIHSRDIVIERSSGKIITDTLSRENLDSRYRKETDKYRIVPGYHVGFIESTNDRAGTVNILGGNQKNAVTVSPFQADYIVNIRRIAPKDVGKSII